MKKYKNKSNIDILKDYVAGVRPFTQVGYVGNANKYRKNGDRWKDKNGIEWEKKDGRTIRLTKTQGDMIREMINQKCKCGQEIKFGSRLDHKFFNRTGMCENCLINYETKLRILGIYPAYERYKVISYELGFVKEARDKVKEVIKFFSENSGDIEMLCNSEGFIERWKNNNSDEILKNAKNDLKLATKRIALITKAKNEAKKKYVDGAKKYKLEIYV
jgi:hypothetical protein